MAQFEKHFVQDLQQDIKIRQCGTIVFNADNLSNVVSVDLYNGQVPASVSGTVVGAVIAPDGATVPVDNGTISGNTVSITLTRACFALPGNIGVGIQVVTGDVATTVLKVIYNAEPFNTDTIVDPGSRITLTLAEIKAKLDEVPTILASAQTAIDGIEAQKDTMIASIASVAGQGTDTTLTQSGVAADAKATGDAVNDLKSASGAIPVACSNYYAANNANITNIVTASDGSAVAFDIGSTANNIGVYSTSMFTGGKKYVLAFDIAASVNDKISLNTKYGTLNFNGSAHYFLTYEPAANASNTIFTNGANPLCRISITNFHVYELVNDAEPSIMETVLNVKSQINEMEPKVSDVDALTDGVPYVLPENVLDLSSITPNTILDGGAPTANDTCFSTDYIPVLYGDVITYSAIFGGAYHHSDIKMVNVCMYTENRAYISGSSLWVNDFTVNQATAKYIRISIPNAALGYTLSSITINNIPTKASITQYVAPHYDANGVSDSVKRSRRVLWLGTSIPTYGYPQILAGKCGCTMFNEAIGSSGITSGITSRISTANICGVNSIWGLYGLTQTVAEKQSMINNWSTIASEIGDTTELTTAIQNIALASSYETIVDPYLTGDKAVDLIVINHGYNDNTENAVAPSGEELNTHYLEGAYNWLIKHILETNPLINIVIFGHYSDLPASKETALQNVADRWNIPYYLLKNDLGWSSVQTINTTKKVGTSGEWETITATDMNVQAMWLGDGVHPLGVATHKIADVASQVFDSWLKMYCD